MFVYATATFVQLGKCILQTSWTCPAIMREQSATMIRRGSGIGRSAQQAIDAQPDDAGADDPPARRFTGLARAQRHVIKKIMFHTSPMLVFGTHVSYR